MGKISNTKGSMQKKLSEMRKKIKQTNQDANACDVGKKAIACHYIVLLFYKVIFLRFYD